MVRQLDAVQIRRLISGACLIVAPAVLLAGALVHPATEEDAAANLANVAANPDRNYAAHALLLFGLALFLPAILGLVHLLKQSAAVSAHAGGGLAVLGLFGATAIVAVDGIAVSQMGRQPGDSADEMAALLEGIKESGGLRAIAAGGALALLFGVLLLAYSLWRTGAARFWTAGGVAAAAVTFFIGQVTDNRAVFALAFALYLISLGPLGWKALNSSDDEWANGSGAAEV